MILSIKYQSIIDLLQTRKVPKEEHWPKSECDEAKPSPVRRVVKTATPRIKAEPGVYHKCEHCGFASPQEVVLHREGGLLI